MFSEERKILKEALKVPDLPLKVLSNLIFFFIKSSFSGEKI